MALTVAANNQPRRVIAMLLLAHTHLDEERIHRAACSTVFDSLQTRHRQT
jgi:hypothetical protein